MQFYQVKAHIMYDIWFNGITKDCSITISMVSEVQMYTTLTVKVKCKSGNRKPMHNFQFKRDYNVCLSLAISSIFTVEMQWPSAYLKNEPSANINLPIENLPN